MLGRIFISLSVFGVFVQAAIQTPKYNSNETEAKQFLTQTSDEMFTFFDDLTDKEYYFDVDIHRNQYKLNRIFINFVNKIVENARKFDFANFKDEELKYAFEILVQLADENIIGTTKYSRILESLKELDFLPQYKEIPKYREPKTNLAFSPDVEEIIKKSSNDEELEYYWVQWIKMIGEWGDKNLDLTVEGLELAANLSEITPLDFWSRGFNITDMEELVYEIKPLYEELHAFVRNLIQKKYGESSILDGLIPDHLFRQIEYQIMTNDSIIEEMFPYEDLPPKVKIEEIEPINLYRATEDFYENLGFKRYPESIWQGHLYVDHEDDNDGENCVPRVIYKTPHVYLNFCEQMSLWDVLESYMNMGFLHYAKEMIGLPAYFFGAPQKLDYAIGKSVILSASTHHNLNKTGMIADVVVPEKVEMNRLLRMALRSVLYLPTNFVHAKVMADLLLGNIIIENLYLHHWDNMHSFAGVTKPLGVYTEFYDFPVNFYKEMNDNLMSSKFTTEILSYQIHKKLCEISENFPKDPLHLCDIGGSKSAGHALKVMMRLGKSKPFYKVLETMFPESPKISTEGILEYYKPLQEMLARENKKANVTRGWSIPRFG